MSKIMSDLLEASGLARVAKVLGYGVVLLCWAVAIVAASMTLTALWLRIGVF